MSTPVADPFSAHYLQTLQRRADAHGDDAALQALLTRRIQNATESLTERCELEVRAPEAGKDEPGTHRDNASAAAPSLLEDLVRYIDSHSRNALSRATVPLPLVPPRTDTWRQEESPVAYFRNTWSRLRVDKKVALALELAPRNAGPINSHHLVLRSLAQMQDISPAYLNRFVTYVDALQSLDAAGSGLPKTPKAANAKAPEKKPKSRNVARSEPVQKPTRSTPPR